ncbi:hypothetical protein CH063_15346, partial [Colletotrichum higginsianum]
SRFSGRSMCPLSPSTSSSYSLSIPLSPPSSHSTRFTPLPSSPSPSPSPFSTLFTLPLGCPPSSLSVPVPPSPSTFFSALLPTPPPVAPVL